MQLRNKQDFWSGVMFIVLGGAFALGSTQYSMGTAARMGPGYFPFWLGVIMAALGLIILIGSMRAKAEKVDIAPFDFKILGIITASQLVFAVALRPLGLIISIVLLVLVSSYASHEHRLKSSIINAIFLTILCYFSFVAGLKLVFPIWPAFLGLK